MDLHQRQVVFDPGLDQLGVGTETLPGRLVPIRAVGSHCQARQPKDAVSQLALVAPGNDTGALGDLHITPHFVAVHPGVAGNRPQALPAQPPT